MSKINVPLPETVQQSSSNTCWLACFRMMLLWRESQGRRNTPAAEDLLNAETVRRFEEMNRPLMVGSLTARGRRFGFSLQQVMGLTQPFGRGFEDPTASFNFLAQHHSPFCFSCTLYGGHMILICGASDTPPYEVIFVDPARSGLRRLEWELFKRLQPTGDPVVYC